MLSDVIVALATPPGRSALATIRVSGAAALACVAEVLVSFKAEPSRQTRLTRAVHPKTREVLDEVLYVSYASPASFTGEDLVEISTHGGFLVPIGVLEALIAAGARQARPGEFTMRAVLNGKMDLLQAEAVGDLVDASAPAQRKMALHQLDRGLSTRLEKLRDGFLELEALISYDIDFPEEDSGPVDPEKVRALTDALHESLSGLLSAAEEGERVREGALAVIAGRPNVGKSSLFNALLGQERAIVTEVPGTTRDTIEGNVTCSGFPFRLADTAGLRESDDRVETLGIEVSRKYIDSADVVILCVEAGDEMTAEETNFLGSASVPVLVARTKNDMTHLRGDGVGVRVSAVTGEGIEELRTALAEAAFRSLVLQADYEPVLTRARHRAAIGCARDELESFATARSARIEAVVAATHLRAAVTALENVIGVVTTEDVLERIFSKFCVGK